MLVNVITRYPAPLPKVLEQTLLENPNGFGTHLITVANRYLRPGLVQNDQVFGSNAVGFMPKVLTQTRLDNENDFGATAIQKLAAGVHHLVPLRVINATQMGAAQLRYSRRYLRPGRASNAVQFGAARVYFATKLLSQTKVTNASQFGAQGVAGVQKKFSYANPLGTGNRTATITVTTSGGTTFDSPAHLVNGDLTDNAFWGFGAITFKFDLGSAKVVRQARWRQDTSTTHSGLFQWQGSNDDVTYADIGGTFNLGGAPVTHHDSLLGNNTAYRYYRLIPTAGASVSGTPYLREVEFYIEGNIDGAPD